MDLEKNIVDGFCVHIFIGSDSIALISWSYMTMPYKCPWIDLCGKAPVSFLKPFILILKGVMVAHNSCLFTVSIYA